MATPSVSVCIPVHNGGRFLAATVRSVLGQTRGDFELVALDNASTDRTAEILRSFDDRRLRVARNAELLPVAENWDRAVALSGAPLVKLLCADDLLHPRCLEIQVAHLNADRRLALVAARRHMIDERNRVIAPNRGLHGLTGVHTGSDVARTVVRNGANPIGEPGGVLFRREHFEAAGGWRTEHASLMDLALWVRLLQHGSFLGLAQTLAAFRISSGSLSSGNDRAIYAEQRRIIDELGDAELFGVSPADRRIGRLRAPAGRARRRALFVLSALTARRAERVGEAEPAPVAWG